MKPAKFELFLGNLGNGTTVCNKAVMEHGDYKMIAHISPAGNITWYVKPESVPGSELLKIERIAEAYEERARLDLDREFSANPGKTLEKMLDSLTISQLVKFLNRFRGEPIEIIYTNLKPLYLSRA